MVEQWEDILNYKGYYQISFFGRVKSLERRVKTAHGTRFVEERYLKENTDKDGYKQVVLSKNCKLKTFKIHRMVAEHFLDNPNNLPQVNHINGRKQDNDFLNLEWVDNLKNTNHYHNKNGTKKYGVHISNNKWRARIKKDGKSIHIGFYEDKDLAYKAFYDKYKELHGRTPW